MASGGYRVEAERWLTIAEKLLSARDLHGAKSFAIRARESDPRLFEFADQVIAVADTMLAGELRINNGNHDYYAILQVGRLTQSMELLASQYRKLALILNPTRNRLTFADEAFRLVSEAWFVFSNPSKKAMYDHELQLSQFGQLGPLGQLVPGSHQLGQPPQSQTSQAQARMFRRPNVEEPPPPAPPSVPAPIWQTRQPAPLKPTESARPPEPQPKPKESSSRPPAPPASAESSRATTSSQQPFVAAESTHRSESEAPTPPPALAPATRPKVPSFWTTCPYCFILYEYPKVYEECALRCQNCKRGFHAAVVPSPPVNSKDQYFCCWGFYPLGYSGKVRDLKKLAWSPFSAMYATSLQAGGAKAAKAKVIWKDDVFIDLSDPSEDDSDSDDDDWGSKKKTKNVRRRGAPSKTAKKSQNERPKKQKADGGANAQEDAAGKGEGTSGRKRKGAKNLGKLDLNVMFSNEVEETVPAASQGHRAGNEEEDSGIGFFEGLDEFLSSLPILSVVGDDKVKAS